MIYLCESFIKIKVQILEIFFRESQEHSYLLALLIHTISLISWNVWYTRVVYDQEKVKFSLFIMIT